MTVVADTHAHLYACYDLPAALGALIRNLHAHAPGAVALAFLAERRECRVFADLQSGPAAKETGAVRVRPAGEPEALLLEGADGKRVYLFAGRQYATAEGIEVAALTVDLALADGLPATDVLRAVRDAGGVPVLPWAPGKWCLRRGRLVRRLIEEAAPGTLCVGDTTLRPRLWPEPRLLRRARQRGLPVLAGSDPLPFAGEERLLGTCVSVAESSFDPARPATSARNLLRGGATFAAAGRRNGVFEVCTRLWRNRAVKQESRGNVSAG